MLNTTIFNVAFWTSSVIGILNYFGVVESFVPQSKEIVKYVDYASIIIFKSRLIVIPTITILNLYIDPIMIPTLIPSIITLLGYGPYLSIVASLYT